MVRDRLRLTALLPVLLSARSPSSSSWERSRLTLLLAEEPPRDSLRPRSAAAAAIIAWLMATGLGLVARRPPGLGPPGPGSPPADEGVVGSGCG